MNQQDAEGAFNNKGVTPEHHKTVSASTSPDSQPDERFYTPNQSTKSSPSKANRQGSSSPDSDKYLSPSESNDTGPEFQEHGTFQDIMTSSIHNLQDRNGNGTTESSSTPNEANVSNNLQNESITNEMNLTSSIVNTFPTAQSAALLHANSELETLPTTAAYQIAAALDTASIERHPTRRDTMSSRLEVFYQLALEREAAHPTQNLPAPRVTIADIPPFHGSSEPRTTASASTDAAATTSPDPGISTQPLTPISEDGEILETESTISAATSSLSALAAEFVPTGPARPVYTNNLPDIPSHWIPLYGHSHGSFFDPATGMIVGDGPPRHLIARPNGTWPVQAYHNTGFEAVNRPRAVPTDVYHIQPDAVTARYVDAHEYGDGTTLFYCSCIRRWTANPHNCVISPTGPVPSQAIWPNTRLPPGWVTRDIHVVDTSYLDTQMGRHRRASRGNGRH